MKNLRQDLDDSLRPEYKRSDFGQMAKGKYSTTQLEFPEVVRLLLACISEDEDIKFIHHRPGNSLASHKLGDWTYEIDSGNQIILRYWLSERENLEEPISSPSVVTTAQDRSELQDLLLKHVRLLKTRVDAL